MRLGPWFCETLLLSGPADVPTTPRPFPLQAATVGQPLTLTTFPSRIVSDPLAYSGHGPMAGLLAALQECCTPWLALMPIDCPFFPPEAFGAALTHDDGCLAIGFTDHRQQSQWLPGLYHRRGISSLEAALAREERGLGRWMTSLPHRFVEWPLPEVEVERAFTNLNSIEAARAAGFLPNSAPSGTTRVRFLLE